MTGNGHGLDIGARLQLTHELLLERARQDAKWGEQNHQSLPKPPRWCFLPYSALPSAADMKKQVDLEARDGSSNWLGITLEELIEAVEATNAAERRAELLQLAAVVLAWVECIDRREAGA